MERYLKLQPVEKTPIWGRELWVIAAHEHGDSVIQNGAWKGKTLRWLWQNRREYFGGMEGERFPLLVKEITAEADLSIQVHPDNNYARVHENGASGKSECWYILEAREGASLILGHNARSRAEAERWIREDRWQDFLREVPVRAGDFFQIDAGCLHSIKGGIRLLEIQQNSDITYRMYDYNRPGKDGKPRPLHVEKSLDVLTFPAACHAPEPDPQPEGCARRLIRTPYYQVEKLTLENQAYALPAGRPFLCLHVLDGALRLEPAGGSEEALEEGAAEPWLTKGAHLLIPGHGERLFLRGSGVALVSSP